MQTVGVGILVTQMTGRAGWTGLVAAAAFVPIGFLSPVGGAMADRVDLLDRLRRDRGLAGASFSRAERDAIERVTVTENRRPAG